MNQVNENIGIIERFLTELNLKDQTPSQHWNYVDLWLEWYEGEVSKFHKYTVYNGKEQVQLERKKLGMAKMVCEDWADLLMNEKVKIMISDKKLKKLLDKCLLRNDFFVQSNQLIEKAFALGEGAFVEYETGDKENPVVINYCNGKMIYPLRIVNGQIIDCAFCWTLSDEKYYATVHIQNEDGSYTITNKIFSEDKDNKIIYHDLPEGVVETKKSAIPLFQIIRPNMANNIDIDCARGLSVFANALDRLKDVDLKFDSYNMEFALGRKRVFVNSTVATFNTDDKGNMAPVFDSNDITFYNLSMGEKEDAITFIEGTLRVEEHDKALQTSLNLLSDAVGFGMDHYTFRDGKVYTNQTQIISSNSKMFRRLKKHEAVLEKSLIDLTKAIVYLATGKVTDKDISIDFDDSIIEDKAEKQKQALLEYNAGLIDKVQYYMQTRNMDESTAVTFIKEMEARAVPLDKEQDPEDDDEGQLAKNGNAAKKDKSKEANKS